MPTAPPDPPPTTPRQPSRRLWESRWWLAGTSLVIGLAMLTAAWIGGHPGLGVGMLAVMVAVGSVFLFGGRSETVRLMARPDERWRSIDLAATAITGLVLILVIIGAFLWQLAHGRDGSPYALLGAIAGVTYLTALLVLRWRSSSLPSPGTPIHPLRVRTGHPARL
jgi:hypothetical protein